MISGRPVSRVVPRMSFPLLLLPADAHPFACVVLMLVESWLTGWCRAIGVRWRVPPAHARVAAFTMLALAVLPVLAYASPPDPSWCPGLYDDGDYDDVVILVTSATGDLVPDAPDVRPVDCCLERAATEPTDVEYSRPAPVVHGRAPPSA